MIKPRILSDDPSRKSLKGKPEGKPRPRWADKNKQNFRTSKAHEHRVAGLVGGRRLPRSGGLAWSKWDPTTAGGDVEDPDVLWEHKYIEPGTHSLSLKREWLAKVSAASLRLSKEPGMIVTLERPNAPPQDWVLMRMEAFLSLRIDAAEFQSSQSEIKDGDRDEVRQGQVPPDGEGGSA